MFTSERAGGDTKTLSVLGIDAGAPHGCEWGVFRPPSPLGPCVSVTGPSRGPERGGSMPCAPVRTYGCECPRDTRQCAVLSAERVHLGAVTVRRGDRLHTWVGQRGVWLRVQLLLRGVCVLRPCVCLCGAGRRPVPCVCHAAIRTRCRLLLRPRGVQAVVGSSTCCPRAPSRPGPLPAIPIAPLTKQSFNFTCNLKGKRGVTKPG